MFMQCFSSSTSINNLTRNEIQEFLTSPSPCLCMIRLLSLRNVEELRVGLRSGWDLVSYNITKADPRNGLPMKPTAKSGLSNRLLAAKTQRKTRRMLRPMENSYLQHHLTNLKSVFLYHTKHNLQCSMSEEMMTVQIINLLQQIDWQVPEAVWSKAWVCGRSSAVIAGFEFSRENGRLSVLSVVCCQVDVSASGWSLVYSSPTDCGQTLWVI
jgi:hypothetical protein